MFEIDAVAIINKIAQQFNTIFKEKNYDREIFVGNERFFIENPLLPNQIGVVVEFGRGLLDFNQIVLPIDLTILSDTEDFDELQFVLYEYGLKYSNTNNDLFFQRYSSPKVNTSFATLNESIRSVWEMSGTIRLETNENAPATIIWESENGEIAVENITADITFSNIPDPQPTLDSYGETLTINRTSSFTLAFSLYTSQNEFYKEILNTQINRGTKNTRFTMVVDFGNGLSIRESLVIVNVAIKQEIGKNGLAVITMAR